MEARKERGYWGFDGWRRSKNQAQYVNGSEQMFPGVVLRIAETNEEERDKGWQRGKEAGRKGKREADR